MPQDATDTFDSHSMVKCYSSEGMSGTVERNPFRDTTLFHDLAQPLRYGMVSESVEYLRFLVSTILKLMVGRYAPTFLHK